MTDNQLVKLVDSVISRSSETSNVEIKDCRGGLYKSIWKSVSGFANSPGGGIILLGIEEVGNVNKKYKVVGGLDLDVLQENIVGLLEDRMSNLFQYKIRVFSYKKNDLIAVIIDETPKENKPCYYKEFGMDKGAYVRSGNVNRQITEDELRSFLRYTPAYNFDKNPVVEAKIDDLSKRKIDDFLERSAKRTGRTFPKNYSRNSVLNNIGIVLSLNKRLIPTIAGVMTFSNKEPQTYERLSRYIVRCVRYAGNSSSSDMIDKKDIYGTLDYQIDEVLKFILRNIKTEAYIVGAKRVERSEYPEIALREMIVNAVVHRDYSNVGTYVQVAVFANRIEVSNPGTLPPGVTIENLKAAQFSRNNIIAQIMRELSYMEEFGRGIDLIYAKMLEWNLIEPLFKNVAGVFKVTLLGRPFSVLNERQIKIWEYLQDKDQITAPQATSLFEKISRATINNDLKAMVDMDLIEAKGASNNTYYVPVY